MFSYIFDSGEWVAAPPTNFSGSSEFTLSPEGLSTVRLQYDSYLKINSSDDYNLFIKAMKSDNALKSKPFFRSFRRSRLMTDDIFHVNLLQKKSQLYCFDNGKPGILLCFCGVGNALNIPISVFHAAYSRLFGSIAYICWHDFNQVLKGIQAIFKIVPESDQLYSLGTSHGAYIPLRLKHQFPDSHGLCFSPANLDLLRCYKAMSAGINPNFSVLNNLCRHGLKVYYSKLYPRDQQFALFCKSLISPSVFSDVFVDVSSIHPRHLTLFTLFKRGFLDEIMQAFSRLEL